MEAQLQIPHLALLLQLRCVRRLSQQIYFQAHILPRVEWKSIIFLDDFDLGGLMSDPLPMLKANATEKQVQNLTMAPAPTDNDFHFCYKRNDSEISFTLPLH